MHPKMIVKIIGILVTIYSLTLLPPIAVALIYGDGALYAFTFTMLATLIGGGSLWWVMRHEKAELKIKDGFLVVITFWTVLGLVGAIPFHFARGVELSLTDAIFESFSGLTTTGATVITGLDNLPHAILWYRQQLQWLGGMGIIVLAVAILPMLGIGGMQLYRAETPGPMKDNKLAPRISETARTLWLIYVWLTIACALAYWAAGMNLFDAIGHSFSTVAIGGFSTHDASIGHFNSVEIEIIAMVFMFIAGINFSLHFAAWRHLAITPYFRDAEFRAYTLILFTGIAISTLYLYGSGVYDSLTTALRYASFQTLSLATTTGFSSTDYLSWPAFIPVMLVLMSFIGGSAGSTGGGMKVIRILLLFRQGMREIVRLLHPNALMPLKLRGRIVPEQVITSVWGFFSLYVFISAALGLLLMALGLDAVSAFSAVAATLNNLGPGLGEVGSHFQSVPDAAKWVLTFAMLLGRLELFTLLVIFTRAFWRT